MKSISEDYCKEAFNKYLETQLPLLALSWFPVPLAEEPPDYYLHIDGKKYAVEMTTLMEKRDVGISSFPI